MMIETNLSLPVSFQLPVKILCIAGLKIKAGIIGKPESQGAHMRLVAFRCGKVTNRVGIGELNTVNMIHSFLFVLTYFICTIFIIAVIILKIKIN